MSNSYLQRDEASDPEISVGALVQAHADDLQNVKIVGERFGKYLLVGEIAIGGMAEVFLGVHKGLEGFIKAVVIKRVLPHLSRHGDFLRMFVDEARLTARLEHSNIVRTYEFGEVNGQYFTAMEYLPGEDLCKALNNLSISKQRMPINIAVGITSQLCAGLHFAHQFTDTSGRPLGLVHRDINPANIIVTYGGEVKIIDFGIAKSNSNERTQTGTIKGKVAYMPPEQVLGRDVDQRADIFSAGVVLWEMLTGRPLFLRDSDAATLYAIMNAPIPPPSKYRHDVPPQLDEIVARALCRSPADRYATAEDLADDLDGFLVTLPRYDARALARLMEELFGSTRAEAKRAIAQTRSLTRNISLVMKLRTEVRVDLAEHLDAAAVVSDDFDNESGAHVYEPEDMAPEFETPIEAAAPSRSQRGLMVGLALVIVTGIGAGLFYTMSGSERSRIAVAVRPASLQIESLPSGAAVFVNGEPTGWKTPATLTGVANAKLAIRLELPDHVPAIETVELVAGTTISKHVALTALPGRLVISDLPVNAAVYVDGDEYAAGEVISVAAGKHVIRIVVAGRTISQQSIDTTAGDQGWKLVRDKLVPR